MPFFNGHLSIYFGSHHIDSTFSGFELQEFKGYYVGFWSQVSAFSFGFPVLVLGTVFGLRFQFWVLVSYFGFWFQVSVLGFSFGFEL